MDKGNKPQTEWERIQYYRANPMQWPVDYLGVREETLFWSQNYDDDFEWDGDKDPIVKLASSVVEEHPEYSRRTAGLSAIGLGKAQPLSENVLTEEGWKKMGELTARDRVYGSDGKLHRIEGIFPQGKRPIYKVTFSDGSSTRADAEHLWTYRYKLSRDWKTKTTLELKEDVENGIRREIPIADPIEFEEKDFLLDPYLLGAFLGDGSMRGSCLFSTADKEVLDRVTRNLPSNMRVEYRGFNTHDYLFCRADNKREYGGNHKPNPLMQRFRQLGLHGKLSQEKYIPEQYFFGSVKQREALLQGLMDTDGTIESGSVVFNSSSKKLIEGVQRLVASLGGVTSISFKPTDHEYEDHWRLTMRFKTDIEPFYLPRKAEKYDPHPSRSRPIRRIEEIEYVGKEEAACIKVSADDSLYVTEDYIVTHNTHSAAWIPLLFMDLYRPARVITLAPKEDQLRRNLWKEVRQNFWEPFKELHPQAEILDLEIRMNPDKESGAAWGMLGYSAGAGADEKTASRARGFHQQHMLIIMEEMTGIHPAVINAFKDTATAPHNILWGIGNPDGEADPLCSFALKDYTKHVRLSALDHPNVVLDDPHFIPGATTRQAINEKLQDVGGDESESMYQSRVRGMIPTVGSDSLYSAKALKKAKGNLKEPIRVYDHDHQDDEVEGETEVFFEPSETHFNQYVLHMDVAGSGVDGDYHAAIMWNRVDRRIEAVVHMRGLAKKYIDACLDLAEEFSIDGHDSIYAKPLVSWERNAVGAHFHNMSDRLSSWPNLYFEKSIESSKQKPRKKYGIRITGGQSGTRSKIIEELKNFNNELFYEPHKMVSKKVYDEAKVFVKQEWRGNKSRYEAAPGHHDDLQMALGGAILIDRMSYDPQKITDKEEEEAEQEELTDRQRRRRDRQNKKSSSIWTPDQAGDYFGMSYKDIAGKF